MEMPKMRKVPEKAYQWAKGLFGQKGYLHYRRKSRKATVFCTVCGREYSGVIQRGESYEAQMMEHLIEKPVNGIEGKCELCGTVSMYKSVGLCRVFQEAQVSWLMGQRMGEDFVFRAFWTYQVTQPEMKTEYRHEEYARIFLRKGKKAEKWWFYYRYGVGDWYFYKGWYNNTPVYTDNIYPGTMKEIEKTPMLQYGDPRGYNFLNYYMAFARYPDMELVQKAGMHHLLKMLINQYGANINPGGKTTWDRLRIYKDRMKMLKDVQGDGAILGILQEERKKKLHYTQKELDREIYLHKKIYSQNDRNTVREILKHTTLEKLDAYREKNRKKNIAFDIYLDYIRMRLRAGYDIGNEIILYPKDLRRRHNEMVLELEKERIDRRKKEVLEKFPQIAEKYKKLEKKYGKNLGEYMIRPARNAAEIVEECRLLHHCVGGDNYLSKHARGESTILFLRKSEAPDLPFCTIEIKGDKILQWYEAYDQKPDKDILQPLLDGYTESMRKGKHDGRTRNTVQAVV